MIGPGLPAAPKRAEQDWAPWLRRTRPSLRASARILVHYWALRQHDLQDLQQTLSAYGLRVEAAELCHTDIPTARGSGRSSPSSR
jgi:hypothetical protein